MAYVCARPTDTVSSFASLVQAVGRRYKHSEWEQGECFYAGLPNGLREVLLGLREGKTLVLQMRDILEAKAWAFDSGVEGAVFVRCCCADPCRVGRECWCGWKVFIFCGWSGVRGGG